MINKQVILFCTCKNNFNKELKRFFLEPIYNAVKDKYDFFVLYNKEKNDDILKIDGLNVINIDNEQLHKEYDIYKYPGGFNTVYLVYEFYKKHKIYEYYWLIEDDMFFTGDWNLLFNHCNTLNNHLICAHYYTDNNYDYGKLIKVDANGWLSVKHIFGWNDLNRFYERFEKQQKGRFGYGFLPIARFSNYLLCNMTDKENDLFFQLYQEYQIPTFCRLNNFQVDTLDKFKIVLKPEHMNNGSITYNIRRPNWLRQEINKYLSIENILVHPIKKENYDLIENYIKEKDNT